MAAAAAGAGGQPTNAEKNRFLKDQVKHSLMVIHHAVDYAGVVQAGLRLPVHRLKDDLLGNYYFYDPKTHRYLGKIIKIIPRSSYHYRDESTNVIFEFGEVNAQSLDDFVIQVPYLPPELHQIRWDIKDVAQKEIQDAVKTLRTAEMHLTNVPKKNRLELLEHLSHAEKLRAHALAIRPKEGGRRYTRRRSTRRRHTRRRR